ncbi:HalOD1 output domain-containing protein [Natronorubrum thiooxidans]|uniref:Halobacterial output domain-containing protein n=1 Tax=Natronorubrum thiooxidans TaxID=308853 RepID=A0A1N7CDG9_9EURY|nr:HalOD1 output domain-containing protein [Natronorubrum thiooxidans]SIR61678.1 hypothetical protein SAMN05421752_101279 [Natronorubrum thiooxidans]
MTASLASVELESLEYSRASETYRARYDQDTTSTSIAVVAAMTNILDVGPLELDQLYYTIDTDALDKLGRIQGTPNGAVDISFAFEGYGITVSSDGVVAISPPDHERTGGRDTGATNE